jgi:hypothetical protein
MGDLRTRIGAYKDHVAVFTTLAALLSVALTQSGATKWDTILKSLPPAAIVFAFLVWLRPRVFPTWRLLEQCLYARQRFPITRSLDDALYCFWWAIWRRRGYGLTTFDVARLRVEAEILTGGKDRGAAASGEPSWHAHLQTMLSPRRLLESAGRPGTRFRTEIPDCLPLTSSDVFPAVDRYFAALATVGRADDHFLSEVRVTSAYLAPLYLLTGQLSHFDDSWRAIVQAYADVTSIDDPIANESLRHLRAFQFACWIVWGPSIPICTCSSWNREGQDAIGFQLGYGDENTSVILYDEGHVLRQRLQRARRRVAHALTPGVSLRDAPADTVPLAVRLDTVAVIRRPRFGDRARLCQAQAELLEADTDRLVLDFRRLEVAAAPGRSYYSAYLWVMFALEASPGTLLMSRGEPWRALLPFFVHGNIADSSTYAFLKERLANEALDAIEAVTARRDTPPDVSFVYMSAIDHPGCGSALLIPDAGTSIRETMRRLLADRFRGIAARVRIEDNPALLRGADGQYYAQLFSSCHLPETIAAYFECLKHLREGKPHGADVA